MITIRKTSQILGVLLVSVFSTLLFLAPTANAAPVTCDKSLLGYPAWNKGLQCDDKTGMVVAEGMKLNDVWGIALNIVQWIIVTVGYVALAMIIWSGFQYMIAQGEPSKIESAKSSLLNAVIGLVIALSAVIIIQTIQRAITGDLLP